MNINYPVGADNSFAPWNESIPKEREIEVTVSITMSKTFKIEVSDYKVIDAGSEDESYDYSECDLKKAVTEQIVLPHEAYDYIDGEYSTQFKKDLSNWDVEDLEIVCEE